MGLKKINLLVLFSSIGISVIVTKLYFGYFLWPPSTFSELKNAKLDTRMLTIDYKGEKTGISEIQYQDNCSKIRGPAYLIESTLLLGAVNPNFFAFRNCALSEVNNKAKDELFYEDLDVGADSNKEFGILKLYVEGQNLDEINRYSSIIHYKNGIDEGYFASHTSQKHKRDNDRFTYSEALLSLNGEIVSQISFSYDVSRFEGMNLFFVATYIFLTLIILSYIIIAIKLFLKKFIFPNN